jgi:hypothetical protein
MLIEIYLLLEAIFPGVFPTILAQLILKPRIQAF